jgi:hypothetical protein
VLANRMGGQLDPKLMNRPNAKGDEGAKVVGSVSPSKKGTGISLEGRLVSGLGG